MHWNNLAYYISIIASPILSIFILSIIKISTVLWQIGILVFRQYVFQCLFCWCGGDRWRSNMIVVIGCVSCSALNIRFAYRVGFILSDSVNWHRSTNGMTFLNCLIMVHDVNPFGYLDIYISIAISDDDAADTTITWRMNLHKIIADGRSVVGRVSNRPGLFFKRIIWVFPGGACQSILKCSIVPTFTYYMHLASTASGTVSGAGRCSHS